MNCSNLGARLLQATSTAPEYQLFALAGGEPRRPGLLRVAAGKGSAIALETWALSAEAFGRFVANVPPPLSIGTLKLDRRLDGEGLPGRGRSGRPARATFRISVAGGRICRKPPPRAPRF